MTKHAKSAKRILSLLLCLVLLAGLLPATAMASDDGRPTIPNWYHWGGYRGGVVAGVEYRTYLPSNEADYSITEEENYLKIESAGNNYRLVIDGANHKITVGGGARVFLMADSASGGCQAPFSVDLEPVGGFFRAEAYLLNFGLNYDLEQESADPKYGAPLSGVTVNTDGNRVRDGARLCMLNCTVLGGIDTDSVLRPQSSTASFPFEMWRCTVTDAIALGDGVDAKFTSCTLTDRDRFGGVGYGATVTMNGASTLALTGNITYSEPDYYGRVFPIYDMVSYSIVSNGRNTLSLKNAEVGGDVCVNGGNTETVLDLAWYGKPVDQMMANGLTMVLAGENRITTSAGYVGGGYNYIYTPDVMVANDSILTIRDDPNEPDVGVLSVETDDHDGGHGFCSAIGGAPAYEDEPLPHGLICVWGGVVNAWSISQNGAAIGGSCYGEADVKYLEETPGYFETDPETGEYLEDPETGEYIWVDPVYVLDENGNRIVDTVRSQPSFSPDGGRVAIFGGVVNAEATGGDAAIGGALGGNGGGFQILGGTVNAKACAGGAAIGAGMWRYKTDDQGELVYESNKPVLIGGNGGPITISGGCVVNCKTDNNGYDEYGNLRGYNKETGQAETDDLGMGRGYVLGSSAISKITREDFISIGSDITGASPVVILQQNVSNIHSGELDASWGLFMPDNVTSVGMADGWAGYQSQIHNAILILIGRDGVWNKDGIPLDFEDRPLRDENGNPLEYDYETGEARIADEYHDWDEVHQISTHVISGWKKIGSGQGSYAVEEPLAHRNYKIRGQISLPAWEDPWYSAEKFTDFTLPEDTTLTLLNGAVMNVAKGFQLHGTQRQLVVEDGAVIQGGGLWPGKPIVLDEDAADESAIQNMIAFVQASMTPGEQVVTHLGVVKSNQNGDRFLIPGGSASEIKSKALDQNATVLTIFNAGRYCFKSSDGKWEPAVVSDGTVISLAESGALCASPSGSADRFKFTVEQVGTKVVVTTEYAKLSSPQYVVYEPTVGAGEFSIEFKPGDSYNTDLAFVGEIGDPTNNAAVFTVPKFMGSEFSLNTVAPLKEKCALRYGGTLRFTTPVADFAGIEIDQLQLEYGGKSVTLGGISGSGDVQVPEFGGFPVSGGAKVRLNTFGGEMAFSMSVGLETPIFEGAFELAFKEVQRTGILMPDTIYAELAVGEGGIPLVPPTVIGYLQGGGLGIEGLADMVNMGSFGAPPLRLKIAAKGSIMDVIDGWVRLSVGPSGFDLSMTDVDIKGLKLIDEYGVSASWDAGKRVIKGKEYQGMNTDMSQRIKIGVGMSKSDKKKVLTAAGTVNLGGFVGYRVEGSNYILIYQLSSSGSLSGSLQIPAGIVGPFPFRNYTLASAEVGYYAAANATTSVDKSEVNGSGTKALRQLAKNARVHFDAAVGAKATIGGGFCIPTCHVRVTYVFGDKMPSFDGGLGAGEPLNLEKLVNTSVTPGGDYTMLAMMQDPESGEEVPAIIEMSAITVASLDELGDELGAAPAQRDSTEYEGVRLSRLASPEADGFYADVTEASVGNVFIAITTNSGNADTLSVKCGGNSVNLVSAEYDENGNLANGSVANHHVEDGVVYFAPPQAGRYTVLDPSGIEKAEVIKMNPFVSLSQPEISNASAAFGVQDAVADRRYKAQVVLGAAEGDGDYLLAESDEFTGSDAYADLSLDFALNGADAPTGDYYPSLLLLEYITVEDENGELIEAWSLVDRYTPGNTVYYDNDVIPAAPQNVTLAYSGNTTMTASWKKADGAESYVLCVYNADGSDTGLLFQVNAPATSLIMDLSSLQPGNYSVGVKALIPDGESYRASYEGRSGSAALRAATPPVLTLEGAVAGEGNRRTMIVGESEASRRLTIRSDKPLDITVTDTATETVLGSACAESLNMTLGAANAVLEIVAVDPDTLDYALEYVTVTFDGVAPSLALDNLGVFPLTATDSGYALNISGLSEAGASVFVWRQKELGDDLLLTSKAADEKGSFTLSLSFGAAPTDSLYVRAKDAAGNLSDAVKVILPGEAPEAEHLKVSFDPNGDGATCATAGIDVELGAPLGELPAAYWTDGSRLFDGWYTAAEGGVPVTPGMVLADPGTPPAPDEDILDLSELPGFSTDSGEADKVVTLYAHWADAVRITFEPGEGSCDISNIILKSGSSIGTLPVPKHADESMMFLGWYTTETGGTAVTESTRFSSETTLYARWTPYVTVYFNAGLGSTPVSEMKIAAGGKIATAKYPDPTATGYLFDGWYNGETKVNNKTVYNADTTLTARWTRITAELAVTQSGCREGEDLPAPVFIVPENTIGEPIITYTRIDPDTLDEETGKPKILSQSGSKPTEAGSYILTVQCSTFELAYVGSAEFTITPITYTVKFSRNGGTGSMSAVNNVSGLYTLPVCKFTPPAGKIFDKWELNGKQYAPGTRVRIQGNVTFKALWKDLVCKVGGSFDGASLTATVTAPKDSVLIVANYNSSGRLIGLKAVSVTGAWDAHSLVFSGLKTGVGYSCKLMLISKDLTPLCEAWSGSAHQ